MTNINREHIKYSSSLITVVTTMLKPLIWENVCFCVWNCKSCVFPTFLKCTSKKTQHLRARKPFPFAVAFPSETIETPFPLVSYGFKG